MELLELLAPAIVAARCVIVWIPHYDITACLNCWGSGYRAKKKNWLHIAILLLGDLSVDECVRTRITSVSIM